jgi:hypothetical protein
VVKSKEENAQLIQTMWEAYHPDYFECCLKSFPNYYEFFAGGGVIDDFSFSLLGDVKGLRLLDTCCAGDAVQAFSWHNAEANVIIHSVDEQRGNAYTAWRKLGSPRHPLPQEMDVIRRSQYPVMDVESYGTNESGELHLSITLPRNGIQLVEVFPRRDQLAQYQGLRRI